MNAKKKKLSLKLKLKRRLKKSPISMLNQLLNEKMHQMQLTLIL